MNDHASEPKHSISKSSGLAIECLAILPQLNTHQAIFVTTQQSSKKMYLTSERQQKTTDKNVFFSPTLCELINSHYHHAASPTLF